MQRLTDFSASTLAHVERHTCFCATNALYSFRRSAVYSCAGVAESPLCRANVLEHISLLRRYFYAGEIPAVSYPNSRGGKLQVISFQSKKRPRFPAKTEAKAREGTRHAKGPKPPVWGLSGQVSRLRSPALRIEQSGIELPPHKKGTNQAAKNHPPKSRMGHGMGQRRKAPKTTEKLKRPETA